MTMVKAHVSRHEPVAGRYRLLDVVHRETNRVSWYGEYAEAGAGSRPCLVTRIGLPAGQDAQGAEQAADRVVRMSRTMARVCPGRVAAVLDAFAEEGSLWTVTEWIDGQPLGQLLEQQGAFGPPWAAALGLELLDVLEAAHGEGITHGELSPGQVFVRAGGPVVVTGFGLAGATLAPRLAAPSYASPEQARDERIGPAADLWALGAILYTAVEGRPPYRDRDRPGTTLRSVDRLPLRTPLRAGALGPTVQALLRKDSRERLTRPVARQALTRVLDERPHPVPAPRPRQAYPVTPILGPRWSGRAVAAGTALAVVAVAVAALAATGRLPGGSETASGGAQARPPASPAPSGGDDAGDGAPATPAPEPTPPASPSASAPPSPTASPPTSPTASPTPSAPASTGAVPAGYRLYRAPEGFSVALPDDWERLDTSRTGDVSYRVTFGAAGDPRTLAVTCSERVGPDPVAVWRDTVEPGLRQADGFRRVGAIEATTYQGYAAADMEWLVDVAGTPVRTFGRGLLLGGHRGFSLRWTTPAADWEETGNRQALDTFLRTFRPVTG
ncbi:serine/threonine protein kinase [Streptomyces sp. NPDC059894]|uniref:serine/threonine protein kinase n=1 Tax=unclassified Streptomyces TaxID=2593676 RepID=UPI003649D145